MSITKRTERLSGPRIFSHVLDIRNTNTNKQIELEQTEDTETRSDETLKQTAKLSKRSCEKQQHAEDMAFLQAIINDKKQREHLRSLLPEMRWNDKRLFQEIQETLLSSGEEYDLSDWDQDLEEQPATDQEPETAAEATEAETSYIAKGKWVSNEEHDARVTYRREKEEEERALREAEEIARVKAGRRKKAVEVREKKKPWPSVGIVIDDLRQPQPAIPQNRRIQAERTDLDTSIAAMPPGSYLAAKLRAHSEAPGQSRIERSSRTKRTSNETSESEDSGTESSNSSGSSSSGKGRKRHRHDKYREKAKKARSELKRLKRAGLKTKLPTPYKGQDNLHKLELWNYEIDEWLEDTGYRGEQAVRKIGGFLRDKAAQWSMDFVAPEPEVWDVPLIKAKLYRYCFPPDMKERIRRDFHQAGQGNKKVIEYLQELKHIQWQLPDITDRQICIKLWNSVHTYIKAEWARSGMNAEDTSLATLRQEAERIETAETIRRKYVPRSEYRSHKFQCQHDSAKDEGREQASGSKTTDSKPQKSQGKDKGTKPKGDKSAKLSREERNELRAQGKCFRCKELGQTRKDSPKRNTAKPSGLCSSALRYDRMDELRERRDQTYLSLASIRYDGECQEEGSQSLELKEITPGESLLDEILDHITPYSRIVVAEQDRLRITGENDQAHEITYREIAKQVRETYLTWAKRRDEKDAENNVVEWSESDEVKEDESEWSEVEDTRIQLNAIGLKGKKQPEGRQVTERNASRPKDITRRMPKLIVVEAKINGHEVRVLLDSGSLGDFITTTVVDQLRIPREPLAKAIGLQMAVTGSRSMINYSVTARLQYQTIDSMRRFDVINLDKYDMILGTPFLYQHRVILSFNPPEVSINSPDPLPIQGETVLEIESRAAELFEEAAEECREALRRYGADLCKTMAETSMPPFRAINHTIALIDRKKRYKLRMVHCPKPLQPQWSEKSDAYIATGRWEYRPSSNAVPMLILMKKSKDGKTSVRQYWISGKLMRIPKNWHLRYPTSMKY